jgi:hypothetical protein
MRFIVKIDPSTMNAGIVYGPSNANEPGEASLSANRDKWASLGAAARNDINDASSTVVSISESARIAAQTADLATKSASSVTQETDDAADKKDHRVKINLDELISDMLSGRKVLGMSAADLEALRSSGANSDLQTRLIEQAAVRAGFAVVRHIEHDPSSPDQTTFQARGIILSKAIG